MRYILLILFGLLELNLTAQVDQSPTDSQGRRHGQWLKYHDNGKLRYQGTFEHGIPVDTFKYYFETGGLRTLNIFKAKSGNCKSLQYGEGEVLAAEGDYFQKKKDGEWKYYNQEGNVIALESFSKGIRVGESKKFHSNGKLAETYIYQEGMKEGPWLQFYDSGVKMAEGNYVEGKLEGQVTYYYSNGKPRIKGEYRNGLMHGNWYYFKDQLKLDRKEVWRYGRKVEPKEEKGEAK